MPVIRVPAIDAISHVFVERGVKATTMDDLRAALPKGDERFLDGYPGVEAVAIEVMRSAFTNFPFLFTSTQRRAPEGGLVRAIWLSRGVARAMSEGALVRAGVTITNEPMLCGAPTPDPHLRWRQIIRECLIEAIGLGEIPEPRQECEDMATHHAYVYVAAFSGMKAALMREGEMARLPAFVEDVLFGFLLSLGLNREQVNAYLSMPYPDNEIPSGVRL